MSDDNLPNHCEVPSCVRGTGASAASVVDVSKLITYDSTNTPVRRKKPVDHGKRVKLVTLPLTEVLVYKATVSVPDDGIEIGDWVVKVSSEVPDATQPSKTGFFGIVDTYSWKRPPGRRRLAKAVREIVARHLLHELDEGLLIDGVRVFDPHKRSRG